jgi:alpha-1,3-mannosyltransferase
VGRLAQLRNLALQPLMDAPGNFTKDSTVMFLNDVAACAEDTLELLHQKRALGADMTCAMDWTYVAQDPSFYDVWISRDINGDSFFEIPPDGSWSRAWTLFWNDEKTQNRFAQKRPFQVFACWNGAAAFATKPIIKDKVLFRGAHEKIGECRQGEPQLFCKDLWYKGYGKIAVIPSVNLEYSIGNGLRIKVEKGYTSDTVSKQDAAGDKIKWQLEPPEKVKCMPTWQNQHWQMWNFTLKG